MTKATLYICIFTFLTFCSVLLLKLIAAITSTGNTRKTVLAYVRSPNTFTLFGNFSKDDGDLENNN